MTESEDSPKIEGCPAWSDLTAQQRQQVIVILASVLVKHLAAPPSAEEEPDVPEH